MRTELAALRSVPAHRRAIALAIAFSGFLAISFLGVRDLASTTAVDARSALSSGAMLGLAGAATAVLLTFTLLGYAGAPGALATALTARRDVP